MSSIPPATKLIFEPLEARRFRLVVVGEMPLGWAAFVATNLSKLGCDVDRARAELDDRGSWNGTIEGTRPLGFVGASADDLLVDVMVSAPFVVPRVSSSSVVRDAFTDRLEVHLRAQDTTGLLASLFRQFGMLGLFPHSFDVRTDRGNADDRFTLAGIAGSRASDRSEREVEKLFERWSARPATAHAR